MAEKRSVEVETLIGKVVEFRYIWSYPLGMLLSSVSKISAWQRVVILKYRVPGGIQKGARYSVGQNPRSRPGTLLSNVQSNSFL